MTSVWIVESGEYSDYSVDAIFSTEAMAQAFATAGGGSFREWPLDTWTPEQVQVTVIFDPAGNVLRIDDSAYTEPAPACDGIECSSAYEDNLAIKVQRGPRERAIKVASEKRIQLIAKLDEAKQRCVNMRQEWAGYWQAHLVLKCAAVLAGVESMPADDHPFSQYIRSVIGGAV